MLLLFVSPLLHNFGIYDFRRGLALGLCSFAALFYTIQRGSAVSLQKLFRHDPPSQALLALLLTLFIGSFFGLAELRFQALSISALYAYAIIVIIYGLVTVDATRHPTETIQTFQYSALLISITAVAQFLGSLLAAIAHSDTPIRGVNLFIYFEHPRFFSQIVSPIFLLVACSASMKEKAPSRSVCWSLVASLFLVCGLGAQGAGPTYALVGSTVMLVGLLLVLKHLKTLKQLSHPVGLMIGAGLIHIALTSWVYGGDTGAISTSDAGRFELWRKTIVELLKHPLSGFGPGSFPLVVEHGTTAHPHNILLQFWFEGGLLAVVALIVFAIGFYSRAILLIARTNDGSDALWMLTTVIWVVTAMLIHAMVSGVALMPISQLLLMCMLGAANGICLGQAARWSEHLSASDKLKSGSCSHLIFLICLWTIVIGGVAVTAAAYMHGRYCPYIKGDRIIGPSLWGQHSCLTLTQLGAEAPNANPN